MRLMATAVTIFLRSPIFPSRRNSLKARNTRSCLTHELPPCRPRERSATDPDTTRVSNRAQPSAHEQRGPKERHKARRHRHNHFNESGHEQSWAEDTRHAGTASTLPAALGMRQRAGSVDDCYPKDVSIRGYLNVVELQP
jgi:hypothetical protein